MLFGSICCNNYVPRSASALVLSVEVCEVHLNICNRLKKQTTFSGQNIMAV